MSGVDDILADLTRRMDGAAASLKSELAGLRAGRASAGMMEPVRVEAYGQTMPLSQLATVTTPETRLIVVQVWDRSQVAAVEKAIRASGLGINPVTEGQVIRLPLPQLNEERRRELSKLASRYAETARVAARNVRRDGMEKVKAMEKEIGKDAVRAASARIQELTDRITGGIDQLLAAKEAEIMQV